MNNTGGDNSVKKESGLLRFLKKVGRFLKKHIKFIIILVIIVGIVLGANYNMKQAKKTLEEMTNQPVTATIDQMDLQRSVSVTGTLSANETAKVTSSIGGSMTGIKVKKINYEVGDFVNEGDVVVEFDGDDYDRKISELDTQYNIDNAESAQSIADMEKSIVDNQAKIDEKQKWLDDKKIYYQNLKDARDDYFAHIYDTEKKMRYETESVACAEYHSLSIEGYEAKEDEVKSLKEANEQTLNKIEIAKLKSSFAQQYTQVDAKDDVYESKNKTHVSAPISGYIITMNVSEGNNYAQGNTVFTIADTSGYVVEATVNEYDISLIQEGLPAIVKFEATGDEEFKGKVTFVSIASEESIAGTAPTGGQTSTSAASAKYKIKITLDEQDERLRVGMTAKASVVMDSVSNVLAVPYDCVQKKEDGKGFFVTVIEDDGSKKDIDVKKGLESDYFIEITGKGLEKGMTVEAITGDAPSTDVMDYLTVE